MDTADTRGAITKIRIVRSSESRNPELEKQTREELRHRVLANGGPLPGSMGWVLASKGFPPERRSGYKSMNTGEASCAVARLGYHVKFKPAGPVKVKYMPAQPGPKKNADGTTSPHPDEARLLARLAALPPLANPNLEKRRRNHLMRLSLPALIGHLIGNIQDPVPLLLMMLVPRHMVKEGGACVPNKDLGESSETMVEKLNLEDAHTSD